MYLDGNNLSRLYFGDKRIDKIFLGDTQIFPLKDGEEAGSATWVIDWEYFDLTQQGTYNITTDTEIDLSNFSWTSILMAKLPVDTSKAVVLTDWRDNTTEELYNGRTVTYQTGANIIKVTRTGSSSLKVVISD